MVTGGVVDVLVGVVGGGADGSGAGTVGLTRGVPGGWLGVVVASGPGSWLRPPPLPALPLLAASVPGFLTQVPSAFGLWYMCTSDLGTYAVAPTLLMHTFTFSGEGCAVGVSAGGFGCSGFP